MKLRIQSACPIRGLDPARIFGRHSLWLLVLLLLGEQALAESFRCGRSVVRVGDSEQALLQRCGEPASRDRAVRELWLDRTRQGSSRIRVERWHYKAGERSLARIVLLHGGEVVGIEVGRR